MSAVHRLLTPADATASRRLGMEAFGFPPGTTTAAPAAQSDAATAAPFPPPGMQFHGMFDGDELVARLITRRYESHFAGVRVPTCGMAGVTVKAEHRGQGLLGPLMTAAFAAARDRGEVISTLFPSAPRIYRKFGYELVGDYSTIEIPSGALASVTRPAGVSARRATPADLGPIQRVYDGWARHQHGPLTRTGPSFDTENGLLEAFDGVTVVADGADEVVGFVCWDRGEGDGSAATFEVSDLIGLTPAAVQLLWFVVGSFSSVTGTVRLDTSGDDLARFPLPGIDWRVVDSRPYMLAVLDVAAALSARTVTPAIAADLEFAVAGHPVDGQDGVFRLNVGAGDLDCRRIDAADGADLPTFTAGGLALLYAGSQSMANLRLAGMLSGGDPERDSVWDALFGGGQFHIRDYF